MKKKQFKSKGKEVVAVAQSPAASLSDKSAKGNQPAASPPGDVVTHLEFPPPHFLLEQAEKEPDRKLLEDYRGRTRASPSGKLRNGSRKMEWRRITMRFTGFTPRGCRMMRSRHWTRSLRTVERRDYGK